MLIQAVDMEDVAASRHNHFVKVRKPMALDNDVTES